MAEHNPMVVASARRLGVTDADMLHAFRNPVRTFLVAEGMTMVIGADTAGRLLEVGVVESCEEPRTRDRPRHARPREVPAEVTTCHVR